MKLYVPNPQKWVDFFERVSSGQASLNQTGGGRQHSIIHVDQSNATAGKAYPIKAVLPAEQTTAQAKSELEREGINPIKVLNMPQFSSGQHRRGIKRKRSNKKRNKKAKRQRGSGKKRKTSRRKRVLRKGGKRKFVNRKKDIFEIN